LNKFVNKNTILLILSLKNIKIILYLFYC